MSPGQLMMIWKGTFTTLVQVTSVNTAGRVLTFANGDSLNLNQTAAAAGNLTYLNAQAPALLWAAAVAVLGGLLPSIRAARRPVVEALRAT